MENFENLGKSLSKTQQKMVSGGNPPEEGGQGCQVTCASGYYSCCYRNILVAYCKCYAIGTTAPQSCDSGGAGSTACQVDHL